MGANGSRESDLAADDAKNVNRKVKKPKPEPIEPKQINNTTDLKAADLIALKASTPKAAEAIDARNKQNEFGMYSQANSKQSTLPVVSAVDLKQFAKDMLVAHNDYRKSHNAPRMSLDNFLCTFAQNWADVSRTFFRLLIYRLASVLETVSKQ